MTDRQAARDREVAQISAALATLSSPEPIRTVPIGDSIYSAAWTDGPTTEQVLHALSQLDQLAVLCQRELSPGATLHALSTIHAAQLDQLDPDSPGEDEVFALLAALDRDSVQIDTLPAPQRDLIAVINAAVDRDSVDDSDLLTWWLANCDAVQAMSSDPAQVR